MKIFALLFVFLISPTFGPDDDPEEDKNEAAVSVEHVDIEPAETLRYTPEYQTLFRSATNGQLHTSLGYGNVSGYFDSNGDYQDLLGQVGGGDINALAWNITGSYDAFVIGDMKLRLGGGLSMYQREREVNQPDPTIGLQAEDTGFQLQNASVFGEILKPNYSFRTGFFYDFKRGEEPDADNENSDGVHALNFSVTVQQPSENFRFFGGADYFLTMRGRTTDAVQNRTVEYAPGDVFQAHGGGGFRFGSTAEAGVTLLFQYNREGQYDGTRGSDLTQQQYAPSVAIGLGSPNRFDSGWVLSAAPYVNYAPLNMPLQVYLKGAVQREYNDYGFAILGESEIAPRLGATVGLIYEL